MMENRDRQIKRITLWSVAANTLLTVCKIIAGIFGRSAAMVADGIHSLSDLLSDAVVLVFTHISAKGKDRDHSFGHGKFETLATLIVSIILIIVGANLMSGGEKTMTAIALMFAVLKTTPTPFCILDEVEAALDDMNIDRFAKYLRNFHDIQFAIVTHQKATMEHADVLYGVTMPEQGISKVLSLRLGDNFNL